MAQQEDLNEVELTNTVEDQRNKINSIIVNTNQVYEDSGNVEALTTTSNNLSNAVNELNVNIGDVTLLGESMEQIHGLVL